MTRRAARVPARQLLAPLMVGVVVLGSLLWHAQPAAAADPPRVTFGIGPANRQGPDIRPLLSFGLPAGAVVFDNVAVTNQSNVPLTLDVYARDAFTDRDGLSIRPRSTSSRDVGRWITVRGANARGVRTVRVPPQRPGRGPGVVVVPITIAVPRDAEPGDHAGGVVAALTARGTGGAQTVDLEQRVATRAYIRVSGPLRPRLEATVLKVSYDRGLGRLGRTTVTYRVANRGNVRLGVQTRAKVSGPFGLGGGTVRGGATEEMLPGSVVDLTASRSGVWPLVRVSGAVTVNAVAPPSGNLPRVAPARDSGGAWAIPWELLALLLLAGLVLVARRRPWQRRGGRRRRPTASSRQLEIRLPSGSTR